MENLSIVLRIRLQEFYVSDMDNFGEYFVYDIERTEDITEENNFTAKFNVSLKPKKGFKLHIDSERAELLIYEIVDD